MDSEGIRIDWIRMKYDEIQEDTVSKISLKSMEFLKGRIEGDFFIEDTGLFIEKLGGFPGPYASYAQKTIGNNGIIKLLGGNTSPAYFETCATLLLDGMTSQFTGVLTGSISREPRGSSGFGYDPIFIPENETRTLAEMNLNEKNSISHRIRALAQMLAYIRSRESLMQ
jgi:XTP/dITP diphosphohydrolase